MELKNIDPISVAKIMGVMYAAMGLIFGGLFAVISLAGLPFAHGRGSAFPGAIFGVAAIIFLPLMYGGIGFVVGGVTAWLYNLFADLIGGVQVTLQPSTSTSSSSTH